MTWSYAERVSLKRQAMLFAAPSFQYVIDRILEEMKIVDFRTVRGGIGTVKGCVRPEFSLVVSSDTFDLFFNSPQGYRGQYHRSAGAGQRANATLVAAMAGKLIAYASQRTTQPSMSAERIRTSLAGDSAKVWINEKGLRAPSPDDITKFSPDLAVEPWLSTAEAYLDTSTTYRDPVHEKAVDGVKAPEGTVLEVKGAFIDQSGQERVAEDKINRAHQIHLYGFS